MVNNIFERKKINLEKVVKKSNNLMNKLLILDLLNNDKLNNYIIELTHKKIYIKGHTIIKDGYLTEYEQFVYVLDNFISHFINISVYHFVQIFQNNRFFVRFFNK